VEYVVRNFRISLAVSERDTRVTISQTMSRAPAGHLHHTYGTMTFRSREARLVQGPIPPEREIHLESRDPWPTRSSWPPPPRADDDVIAWNQARAVLLRPAQSPHSRW
jgi:hypothetical protein